MISIVLYGIAALLIIYVVISVVKARQFKPEYAIEILAIVVAIIIALNIDEPKNNPIPPTTTVLDLKHACGTSYTIGTGKPFMLRYGMWFARGTEIAEENSNHLTVTLTIDGQIVNGAKQPVQRVTSSWPGALCSSPDFEEGYGVFYIANINPLSPGNHSVHISYLLDAQITDGYDDNNGNPNIYGPGQFATFDYVINATE